MPDASRFRFRPSDRHALVEVPISTLRLRGRNLPSGGGGYFRLLPYGVSRWALRRIAREDRQPTVFYFHPWEIDPGQRSEEHTSELQSLMRISYAVFCLTKKNNTT